MTKKIIINCQYGGFSLSDAAIREYYKRKNIPVFTISGSYGFIHYYDELPPEGYNVDETNTEHNDWSNAHYLSDRNIPRDDPILVSVVEDLGEAANGSYATLKVVEIPDDAEWEIAEYDGYEHVAEKHRTWG